MCSNYEAATDDDLWRWWDDEWEGEQGELDLGPSPGHVWPGFSAPILTNANRAAPALARFGMLMGGGTEAPKFSTFNAKSEELEHKRTYAAPWLENQFCIIPARSFIEPYYPPEGGKQRWTRIFRRDGRAVGIAGLWKATPKVNAVAPLSFTMLTMDATHHPLMHNFHKPGDPKRTIIVLDPSDYRGWLDAKSPEEARSFLRWFDPDDYTTDPPINQAPAQPGLFA